MPIGGVASGKVCVCSLCGSLVFKNHLTKKICRYSPFQMFIIIEVNVLLIGNVNLISSSTPLPILPSQFAVNVNYA